MLVLAPVALAQDTTMMEQTQPAGGGETTMMEQTQPPGGGKGKRPLPKSGGPAILLPAAALLLGSGVLTYAVLRRR
jgi:hypothetical protein